MAQPKAPQPKAPHPSAHALVQDPEFQELVKRKNTISTSLTIVMLLAYFGFMGILAFSPSSLSAPFGRATIGIPFGIGVIIFAIILTGLYVQWANTKYDSLIAHIKARVQQAEFDQAELDRVQRDKEDAS